MPSLPSQHATDADKRHFQEAQGYLELGMLDDAWTALDQIEPEGQSASTVIKLRMKILMEGNKWEKAVWLGETLCKGLPDDPEPFFQTAFCLHELKRTREAKETLLRGPPRLREDALFHFNLACYAAQLGELEEAKRLVRAAIALDRSLQEEALDDPDLEPIWQSLAKA